MKINKLSDETLGFQRHASFSRRYFLRGLGACLALPAFQSIKPLSLLASERSLVSKLATTASGAPLRAGQDRTPAFVQETPRAAEHARGIRRAGRIDHL